VLGGVLLRDTSTLSEAVPGGSNQRSSGCQTTPVTSELLLLNQRITESELNRKRNFRQTNNSKPTKSTFTCCPFWQTSNAVTCKGSGTIEAFNQSCGNDKCFTWTVRFFKKNKKNNVTCGNSYQKTQLVLCLIASHLLQSTSQVVRDVPRRSQVN